MLRDPRLMKWAQEEVREVFGRKGNVDETGLQELKFLKVVIKETLRLHPPVPLLLPRECTESCRIFGYQIPSKTRVLVNAWEIGRDPMYWTEPERFYPERFLNNQVDYPSELEGGCALASHLPHQMLELPLTQLLYHFDWKLPEESERGDLDMTESFGVTVRRKKELYLIPTPYLSPNI